MSLSFCERNQSRFELFWSQILILLAKLWATWAAIVFYCLSMAYHWATFVYSPLVAHKQLSHNHMTSWLIFHSEKILSVMIISFSFKFIASSWSQILILLAKLWATSATIVFYCLSMGYHWATFVCSPLVAHKQLSQIHMTFWLSFHSKKILSVMILSF